jgi:hypothetical protein
MLCRIVIFWIDVVLSAINQLSPVQKHTASSKKKKDYIFLKGETIIVGWDVTYCRKSVEVSII